MSSLAKRIVDQINSSNSIQDLDAWIWKAGDLLEKVHSKNFHSGFVEIDKEEVSPADAQAIQAALLNALHRNSEARYVGAILSALGGSDDKDLKRVFEKYLAEYFTRLRESNSVVYSALMGLDKLGEPVFERDSRGRSSQSLIEVDKNVRQADKYLSDRGYKIPW